MKLKHQRLFCKLFNHQETFHLFLFCVVDPVLGIRIWGSMMASIHCQSK